MNWKNTWILVSLAAALFAFIALFERRLNPTGFVAPPPPLFARFNPAGATALTLRRGNEFTLALQRTNDVWRFTKPSSYPAADFAVQNFLEMIERIVPATHITPKEILSRKQTSADFGFDAPPVALTLERGGDRYDLRLGARTPAGDQVYLQVGSEPSIYVVSADLLERIPRTPYDWRNAALFDFGEEKPHRIEVSHNGTGYLLQLDATNHLWRLARPAHRADQNQVRELLRRLQTGRVVEFVTDDPRADDEAFGLQTPKDEVTITAGGLTRTVQFGRSPTNKPGLVYARLLAQSNVVLVPKAAVEPLALPYAELRERQIVSFAPELVDVIEVRGEENFTVRRDAAGAWKAGELPADAAFVAETLHLLSQLEATNFVRDVVTDFAPYGLKPGQRQYTLRTIVTNAVGATNIPIAQLAFGVTNRPDGTAFARRLDEDSVYAIRAFDYERIPGAAWQFRDHRVWSFTTNQVLRITVRQNGTVREVLRQPNGDWVAVKPSDADINPFALEETTRNLGELTAAMWMGRGEGVRERFGFDPNPGQFIIELRGETPRLLTLEFGGLSPLRLPYAFTTVDGQPTVFEFPWTLYADLQRYFQLAVPQPRNGR